MTELIRIEPVGGRLLVAFGIPGKAVPWKAPTVTRWSTFKSPQLIAWQQVIALHAHRAWGGEHHVGPVEVHFWYLRKAPRKLDLFRWFRKRPDVDNVLKAFLDTITGQALKGGRGNDNNPYGRIIEDDSHVVSVMIRKQYWTEDALFAAIYTVDEAAPAVPFGIDFKMNEVGL